MNLKQLISILRNNSCQKVYIKTLSANDLSKSQVYFSGSFEELSIFPILSIITESKGDDNISHYKVLIDLSWISNEGGIFPAPNSKLILYPQYPEVRFSGFLQGCQNAPSEIMKSKISGRLLLFSVTKLGKILAYATMPTSEMATEINELKLVESIGVFKVWELNEELSSKAKLLIELKRIHSLNWINSKRLDKNGLSQPCKATNCGGYTLEAELGITPNGFSEPDFLDWEVKQFNVKKFTSLESSTITLMTPEPNGGYYKTNGLDAFLKKYGYIDSKSDDRMNFTGRHKCGLQNSKTRLKLVLAGFDSENNIITNANGAINLIDENDEIAASWRFDSLLLHWLRKHNQACYVPSMLIRSPELKYKYGNKVILGIGTDFKKFISSVNSGDIYYDPGIKIEKISSQNPIPKKRSQFRIRSKFLKTLYTTTHIENLE